LLGPLLGLVFLIYPVRAVLTSYPTLARVSLALGGAVLFAAVSLWLMWRKNRSGPYPQRLPRSATIG